MSAYIYKWRRFDMKTNSNSTENAILEMVHKSGVVRAGVGHRGRSTSRVSAKAMQYRSANSHPSRTIFSCWRRFHGTPQSCWSPQAGTSRNYLPLKCSKLPRNWYAKSPLDLDGHWSDHAKTLSGLSSHTGLSIFRTITERGYWGKEDRRCLDSSLQSGKNRGGLF